MVVRLLLSKLSKHARGHRCMSETHQGEDAPLGIIQAAAGRRGRSLSRALFSRTLATKQTALDMACAGLHAEGARDLVKHGADPYASLHSNCRGKKGGSGRNGCSVGESAMDLLRRVGS